MSEEQPKLADNLSPSINKMIEDGLRLVSYIAKNGNTELPHDLAQAMVNAKFKATAGQWTDKDETEFLVSYDKLSTLVYPVTVESIHAITPNLNVKGKSVSAAEHSVKWYRRSTMVALGIMLIAHLYFIIGNNLRVNLTEIFDKRTQLHQTIDQTSTDLNKNPSLREKLAMINQELDASYQLLKAWNSISAFGHDFRDNLPEYTSERIAAESASLVTPGESPHSIDKANVETHLNTELYKARLIYFKNIQAADFFLSVFQGYLLPLLYGLLGAFIFVLRSLHSDIQSLTYTRESEIKYRLRLTLGMLGGMVIGWFFKPSEIDVMASLSPMAVAFLMGYNVDVLFSIMDKVIDTIRQSIEKPPEMPTSSDELTPKKQQATDKA